LLTVTPTQPHANNESNPIGLEVPDPGRYADRDWPEAMKLFAALVTRLDEDVGAILAELDTLGLAENTLVIFSSDNGPHRESGAEPAFFNSAGGLRGIKRDLYEGGIRVPFLVRWPGRVPAGRSEDKPIHFADVLPTLAALTGAEPPAGIDGTNVLPTFLGQSQPELRDRLLLWEFYEGGYKVAARRGDWKVVRPNLKAAWELYHLAVDPAEKTNLAATHPETITAFEDAIRGARTDSSIWPVTLDRYPGSTYRSLDN
jgi:arylsulfatase A-like enzyme